MALLIAIVGVTSTASARTTRAYEGSFGNSESTGLAVDQSNGDVYAFSLGQVLRFTAAGAPKNFTAGPAAGSNVIAISNTFGAVAIDNSGGPLNGTLYVANNADNKNVKVEAFAPTGAPLGAISGNNNPGGRLGSVEGLAVDQSDGSLYVAAPNPGVPVGDGGIPAIWRYAPASPGGAIDDDDYAVSGINVQAKDLAAGSGHLYAIDYFNGQLQRYSAADFSPAVPKASGALINDYTTAVAVDPKTGEVYANEGNSVVVFDSAGIPLYEFGAGAYFGMDSQGIAVKSAPSGPATKAYVSDPTSDQEVDVFGAFTQVLQYTHDAVASFGPDGTSATQFSDGGSPALAFEDANRRLYALEKTPPGVHGFDASAPPTFPALAGFTPLGTAALGNIPGLALDNTALPSAGNLYLASQETDLLYGWDDSGTPLGGAFPIDPAVSPGAPDGSPKDLCGVAVDSEGEIWVANSATSRILHYDSAGSSLPGTIDTSAQGKPCRLTFDSTDNLYVTSEKGIHRYSAASGYTSSTSIMSFTGRGFGVNVLSIAVDRTSDHLFVATHGGNCGGNCGGGFKSWVDEFDPAGKLLDEFAVPAVPRGIAIDPANKHLYVSAGNQVRVIGPGYLLPEATTKPATDPANDSATLNGGVVTQGVPLTDCHFEYVSLEAFRLGGFSDLSSGGSVPCTPAAGMIPLDLKEHPVSATATGLGTNAYYRFRLVTANVDGSDVTPGAAFASSGPPEVETTGSPIRTATSAQLGGRVWPVRAPAEYRFEYGTDGPCDSNPCTSTEFRPAGSGDAFRLISEQITGLEPDTTYHYRVIADNGNPDGPAVGMDMTVTTHVSDEPLSHGHFAGPPGSDRAWEQVSLPDTGGNPVEGVTGAGATPGVSANGDRVLYGVTGGTPLAESGSGGLYQADRTPSGWQTRLLAPPRKELLNPSLGPLGAPHDLSQVLVKNTGGQTGDEVALWRLAGETPATKLFQPVPPQLVSGGGQSPVGVSDDLGTVVTSLRGGVLDPTYPAAAAVGNLYDVSSGSPQLLSLLPGDALAACGATAALPQAKSRWLSEDGSRLFFASQGDGPCFVSGESPGAPFQLYMRDLAAQETRLLSPPPVSGPACVPAFVRATPDAAFFWTQSRLVVEDTVPSACSGGADGDVYRYEIASEGLECLTCLGEGLDADVSGNGPTQIGVSEDGSRLYFNGAAGLIPGTGGIYRLDVASGELAHVGTGGPVGYIDPMVDLSADGALLLFRSSESALNPLGGPNNDSTAQYYRYDDRDRSLVCVSCPIDGSAPEGDVAGNFNVDGLATDGTFAFATPTPLVSADQNTPTVGDVRSGTDVYEWRDGRQLLVTDGLTNWTVGGIATEVPRVSAISRSGRDVYFLAPAQYTPDALDGYPRLYDARIGGGIDFPTPPPPCPLEVCQGTPKGAPADPIPSSASFAGAGNVKEQPSPRKCRKGRRKVRRAGKTLCVKKPHRQRRQAKSRANRDRRTH